MENYIYITFLSGIISFLISIFLTGKLIPVLEKQSILSPDLNKMDRPMIPEMGGISVIFAFFFGMNVSLIWISSTDFELLGIDILGVALFTIMGVGFVGIMDDLLGLGQLTKTILPFFIAIPLGIGLPDSSLTMPLMGRVSLGWLTILLVPLGITAVVNLTNILEGFNGLGCGLGIIITITLILMSFITEKTDGLVLLIPLLGALIGFFFYNKFPSRIFPGDTLTFFQGATIGCAAVIGNLKTLAAILYVPLLLEFILKARGRFPPENHGTVLEDGTLNYDKKVFSLSHLLMKYKKVTERKLVAILWTMEAVLCAVMIVVVYLLGPEYAW
jgi:UDP-N-acetylglucosamine--dolichyl-phosphate N-acetylglucosaminephosphotransferase